MDFIVKYNRQNPISVAYIVWRETLALGKLDEFGKCSWICQILTIQLFCHITNFRDEVALLGITFTWLVAGTVS